MKPLEETGKLAWVLLWSIEKTFYDKWLVL